MDVELLVPVLGDWSARDRPLNEALASALAGAIERGELEPGMTLPAERTLAAGLGVSRGTVVGAYRRLRERGLASTRHGSGTVVGDGAGPVARGNSAPLTSLLQRHEGDVLTLRSADWADDHGLPDDLFEAVGPLLADLRHTSGYVPAGLPALRRAIAEHLDRRGLPTAPDQVLVTTGAQQAISLLVSLLVGPGEPVVVERLTYPGALDALRAAGAVLHPVPMTPAGVDVGALGHAVERSRPGVIYLVPGVHNPTGIVLPRLARRRIAELLAERDAVLVEDVSLADTQLRGEVVPPIASFADGRARSRIVTIGSLSKIGWAGLRVGWIRAPVQLIGRLTRVKLGADLGSAVPTQAVAVHLVEQIEVLRQRRVQAIGARLDLLDRELTRELPEWRWQRPAGGLCLWLWIGGDSSLRFVPVALRHGIAIAPGTVAAADGSAVDHVRLPFGHPPDVLREAVARLAAAWRDEEGDYRRSGAEHVLV